MKKMLVIGDGDSVFVKDFINQYHKEGVIVDLISYGKSGKNETVRLQKNFQIKLGFNFSAVKNFFEFRNNIIDKMDGTIYVENFKPAGRKFTIILPRKSEVELWIYY